MTLHFYFARRFFKMFASVFAVFFLFMTLIDLVEQMRRFGSYVSFGEVVYITMLKTPQALYQILPLVMIISTVSLFIALARSSELVVARSVGRSALHTLIAPITVAFLIGLVAVSLFNPIVAATSVRYGELSETYSSGSPSAFSIGREGLWLRQGGETGQTVIRAARANFDGSILFDVSMLNYSKFGGPNRRIEADQASLRDGMWILERAKVWPLIPGINSEEAAQQHDILRVESTLTREQITDQFGNPSSISVWDLPKFIDQLDEAGFSARRYAVWMQMELARPFFLVAMMLIGAAFTMKHSRFGGTGLRVLSAVLLGFGLYYVRNFAQILGDNGQLPIVVAAWVPALASIALALGLILQMEDG